MAANVSNRDEKVFGTISYTGPSISVAKVRIRRASDDANPIIKSSTTPVPITSGTALSIGARTLNMKFPKGDFTDDLLTAMAQAYWGTATSKVAFEIDLLTAGDTVLSDISGLTGYSQQTIEDWVYTVVAD